MAKSTAELTIDWCPRAEVRALQAFIGAEWKKDHILSRDEELLCWQHSIPDDPERISVLMARRAERLVGILGIIRFPFCVRGARHSGAWLTTWVRVPDPQEGAVGLRLLRRVMDGAFDMVGTLGGNALTLKILERSQFAVYESVPRWVRVFSVPALRTLLADRPEPVRPETWEVWDASARAGDRDEAGGLRRVEWNEQVAARWDESWHSRFAQDLVGTWRDAAYLHRRYLNHPRLTYSLVCAEEPSSGTILGLLVYRLERIRGRDETVLRLLEFLAYDAAVPTLAAAVEDAARASGAVFADFYCTGTRAGAALEASGFVREREMSEQLPRVFQPLEFRPGGLTAAFWADPKLSAESRRFFDTESLYFTRSDCDQERPN